jgi:deoxyribonuclease V
MPHRFGFAGLDEAAVLEAEQRRLAELEPGPWEPPSGDLVVAGAFVAFARGEQGPGRAGDHAFVGAAATVEARELLRVVVEGAAPAPYRAGLLAAREGGLLEGAVRALMAREARPHVVLVDATGRDHPRRAGLAVHLGAVLDVPTVGVTHRPLLATGPEPPDAAGAWSPLVLDGEVVGAWLRTRRGVRPVAVHAGWRTDPGTAVAVVLRAVDRSRTPEPLRLARCAAREARAAAERCGRRPSVDRRQAC